MSLQILALNLLLAAGSAASPVAQHAPATPTSHPQAENSAKQGDPDDLPLTPEERASEEARENSLRDHARTLARRGDARSLLAATLIYPNPFPLKTNVYGTPVDAEARTWFDAARRSGQDDATMAWIDANQCTYFSKSCDKSAAVSHLLQLEPDNAAAHLLAASTAYENKDDVVGRAQIALAAQASQYRTHYFDVLALLHSALQDWSPPTITEADLQRFAKSGEHVDTNLEDQRDAHAYAIAAAYVLPPMQVPVKQCLPNAVPTPDKLLHEDCVRVFRLMAADSETMLNQAIALSALSRLTFGDAEGAGWREQFRQLRWVENNYLALLLAQHDKGMDSLDIDTILHDGEMAQMRSALRTHGIAVDPPAGWLPDSDHDRELILYGRLPARK
ncbi:MAG TPA: hypothetical protein VGH80_02720 [Xanthomonadaceae bacterium]|jgi:hypothetical protein